MLLSLNSAVEVFKANGDCKCTKQYKREEWKLI